MLTLGQLRGYSGRLKQIAAFAAMGSGLGDTLKLAVAGYARGHPFDSVDLISRIGRTYFPSIVARPRRFGWPQTSHGSSQSFRSLKCGGGGNSY